MKNPILILLLPLILFGCEQQSKQTPEQHRASVDSFTMKKYGRHIDEQVKHMVDSDLKKAVFDTVGVYKSQSKF